MSLQNSNEWSGGEYINLGPSGAIAAADYALARFQKLGISLPPNNRLVRARRLLQSVNDRSVTLVQDDPDLVRTVTEAQWTVLDFYLVARATGRNVTDQHRAKILMALAGADRPEDDKNHLARNTAFELVTAATLTMGGVRVALSEPDLNVMLGGQLT